MQPKVFYVKDVSVEGLTLSRSRGDRDVTFDADQYRERPFQVHCHPKDLLLALWHLDWLLGQLQFHQEYSNEPELGITVASIRSEHQGDRGTYKVTVNPGQDLSATVVLVREGYRKGARFATNTPWSIPDGGLARASRALQRIDGLDDIFKQAVDSSDLLETVCRLAPEQDDRLSADEMPQILDDGSIEGSSVWLLLHYMQAESGDMSRQIGGAEVGTEAYHRYRRRII